MNPLRRRTAVLPGHTLAYVELPGTGVPLVLLHGVGSSIDTWGDINLFECFTRNQFHIDPDYEFRPEQDYPHDIRLMKHHLKCHRKTIKELGRWR